MILIILRRPNPESFDIKNKVTISGRLCRDTLESLPENKPIVYRLGSSGHNNKGEVVHVTHDQLYQSKTEKNDYRSNKQPVNFTIPSPLRFIFWADYSAQKPNAILFADK